MYEKGNSWGLVLFVSEHGLGILCNKYLHNEWSNGDLYNLLLCLWQLHNKLLLRENTYLTVGFFMVYILACLEWLQGVEIGKTPQVSVWSCRTA